MSLANDYFLLYHGISFEEQNSSQHLSITFHEETLSLFSLVLITTRKEFDKYISLQSFLSLFPLLKQTKPKNMQALYLLQYKIIQFFQSNNSQKNSVLLQKYFAKLKEEEILSYDNYKKINSLFAYAENNILKYKQEPQNEFVFQKEKEKLLQHIKTLQIQMQDKELLQELQRTFDYLHNQKFSIGITGVINAGKSTMLNALLKKKLLGSSVVPETANLSVIKYAQKEEARIFYWNTMEWQKLLEAAQETQAMHEFIQETQDLFGDELHSLILEKSKVQKVAVQELSVFTSAKSPKKICNLIKYVELSTPLDFLQDGIEIVDTPGLDDPVTQREEITKEYINNCDMMLHLMNVSQSATIKDVVFIIDALLYQNVTKLLVVITRADTVSKEELQQVITYTKESIKQELYKQNKDAKLDYILQTIEFIPISALMALLHRTGREEEALRDGFSLEDTGILQIEEYLKENLFGASSIKSELIIKSAQTQVLQTINKQKNALVYELQLSTKSKQELQKELDALEIKKEKDTQYIALIYEDILAYKQSLQRELQSSNNFLQVEFLELKTRIKQRVVSDVRYSLQQNNTSPKASRIEAIIQTAVKDGIIDIVRDYRYKLIKKIHAISEQYLLKYQDFASSFDEDIEVYDIDTLFLKEFKTGFLLSNNEYIVHPIVELLKDVKLKKIESFDASVDNSIQTTNKTLQENTQQRANNLASELIQFYFMQLALPIQTIQQKLLHEQESLKRYLAEDTSLESSLEIHAKIKKLDTLKNNIQSEIS